MIATDAVPHAGREIAVRIIAVRRRVTAGITVTKAIGIVAPAIAVIMMAGGILWPRSVQGQSLVEQ